MTTREEIMDDNTVTRRTWIAGGVALAVLPSAAMAQGLRKFPNTVGGFLPIMETPFTEAGAVDYGALAAEARFIAKCGAHCMIWGQIDDTLDDDERQKGMDLIMKVNRELPTRICLGVNGRDVDEMVKWAKRAEAAEPDWIISRPPANGSSQDIILDYYRALGKIARRPVIIQSSGPGGVYPSTDTVLQLAKEFPATFGYVKEESPPGHPDQVMARQMLYLQNKPPMKVVMSANFARGLLMEMRFGIEGFVSGSGELTDVLQNIWNLHTAGKTTELREAYANYALMRNLIDQMPSTMYYLWKKRGVFKSTTVRKGLPYHPERTLVHYSFTQAQQEEIEYRYAALKPYLVA
jgi:dihydrodipicolinate synthase/N-acetylneuraminate lyase